MSGRDTAAVVRELIGVRSVPDAIEEIGREAQADPSKSMDEDTQGRLTELRDQLQEMGWFE